MVLLADRSVRGGGQHPSDKLLPKKYHFHFPGLKYSGTFFGNAHLRPRGWGEGVGLVLTDSLYSNSYFILFIFSIMKLISFLSPKTV